ncbi:MAG TPA: MOSC domain-containing protein [Pyrinomonadaceae bacterium]|nr:MOSC domain-containing protein [Pyrinomonadaceae bacterium]
MKTEGRIFQINCSRGGVPKMAVREASLTTLGIEGDSVAHPDIHGGPDRAVCLYALEQILKLQAEGHPIFPGSVGENLTIAGLDWSALRPGARLALGDEAIVELTSYTGPCSTIAASFAGGQFKRISQKVNPGESRIYARVLRIGRLAIGQTVRVLNGAEPDGA